MNVTFMNVTFHETTASFLLETSSSARACIKRNILAIAGSSDLEVLQVRDRSYGRILPFVPAILAANWRLRRLDFHMEMVWMPDLRMLVNALHSRSCRVTAVSLKYDNYDDGSVVTFTEMFCGVPRLTSIDVPYPSTPVAMSMIHNTIVKADNRNLQLFTFNNKHVVSAAPNSVHDMAALELLIEGFLARNRRENMDIRRHEHSLRCEWRHFFGIKHRFTDDDDNMRGARRREAVSLELYNCDFDDGALPDRIGQCQALVRLTVVNCNLFR